MAQQIGEVTIAYFTRIVRNQRQLAVVDGESAGKLIGGKWQQITAEEYVQMRGVCTILDLRRKPE
jgi:hypothetical protein